MVFFKYNKLLNVGSTIVKQEKFIKLPDTGYTSKVLGIKMPSPTRNGKWVGWCEKQTEEFLEYLRNLPQKNDDIKC